MEIINRVSSLDSIPDVDFISCSSPKPSSEVTVSEFRAKELRGDLDPEPLLQADKARFVLFPIKHTDVSCRSIS